MSLMDNSDLYFGSLVFMIALTVWSLAWILLSVVKIKSGSTRKIMWQTHFVWSCVNLIIAAYSLVSTLSISEYSYQRGVDMKNIVAINILLDIGYLLFAVALFMSKKEKLHYVAQAIVVQALFLLLLDSIIVLYFLRVL